MDELTDCRIHQRAGNLHPTGQEMSFVYTTFVNRELVEFHSPGGSDMDFRECCLHGGYLICLSVYEALFQD